MALSTEAACVVSPLARWMSRTQVCARRCRPLRARRRSAPAGLHRPPVAAPGLPTWNSGSLQGSKGKAVPENIFLSDRNELFADWDCTLRI